MKDLLLNDELNDPMHIIHNLSLSLIYVLLSIFPSVLSTLLFPLHTTHSNTPKNKKKHNASNRCI